MVSLTFFRLFISRQRFWTGPGYLWNWWYKLQRKWSTINWLPTQFFYSQLSWWWRSRSYMLLVQLHCYLHFVWYEYRFSTVRIVPPNWLKKITYCNNRCMWQITHISSKKIGLLFFVALNTFRENSLQTVHNINDKLFLKQCIYSISRGAMCITYSVSFFAKISNIHIWNQHVFCIWN